MTGYSLVFQNVCHDTGQVPLRVQPGPGTASGRCHLSWVSVPVVGKGRSPRPALSSHVNRVLGPSPSGWVLGLLSWGWGGAAIALTGAACGHFKEGRHSLGPGDRLLRMLTASPPQHRHREPFLGENTLKLQVLWSLANLIKTLRSDITARDSAIAAPP